MAAVLRARRSLISRAKTLFPTVSSSPLNPPLSFEAAKKAVHSATAADELASDVPRFCRQLPIFPRSIDPSTLHRRPDATMFSTEDFWIRIITLYSKAGMIEQGMKIFHQMEARGCQLTEKSLCAILSLHLNNGRGEKVLQLFESIPNKYGISPSLYSYNLILKYYCRNNEVKLARELIEKLESEGRVMPDFVSYNHVLGSYLDMGDESGFDSVLDRMVKLDLHCNCTTYFYRVKMLCEKKDCAGAVKLLDEMISRGVKPSLPLYNTIADAFCSAGDLGSARKVYERMSADGYAKPSAFTYSTLIEHMVKEGEFKQALEMCEKTLKWNKWFPQPELVKGLGDGLVKMCKVEEAKAKEAKVEETVEDILRGVEQSKNEANTMNVLRPLSPHLPIYKPQLNSTASIFNRMTGVFLTTVILGYYLLYMKMGLICFTYESFYQFLLYSSELIPISVQLSALAVSYHVYKSVPHLWAVFGKH